MARQSPRRQSAGTARVRAREVSVKANAASLNAAPLPAAGDQSPAPRDESHRPRTVKEVVSGGPINDGDAVQFEFEFADGSREKFHAACRDVPKIVSNLRGYTTIAARTKRSDSSKPVDLVNPYHATDAQADRVGPLIVVRFPTTDGIPLLVAMDEAVCERLQRDLEDQMT